MNAMNNESEMITSRLEGEMRKLIIKAQREVVEVCAKEYNFDINAAMLLVNAGGERKVAKKPTASSGIAKVAKERKEKVVKEKKPTASGIAKAVKELIEGEDKRKSKGRPKNPEKVVEVEATENLFEQLVNTQLEQVEEDVACSVVFQTKEEKKTEEGAEKEERGLMSVEEKETKVVNKAEAKEAAKLAKLEAKEAEKLAKLEATASAIAAKEQAKLEAIAAKEADKQAKEQEKLAKEQAKEQEKLAKEKAKEAKEAEKLAKSQEKKTKKTESGSDSDTSSKSVKKTILKKTKETAERVAKEKNDVEYQAKMTELSKKLEAAPGHQLVIPVASVAVVAEAPATLKVKSFKYEGATYFREKNTGAIYDKETNDHLGQWNEATQKIEFLEPEEELEEEEESAGESSDEEEEEEDVHIRRVAYS